MLLTWDFLQREITSIMLLLTVYVQNMSVFKEVSGSSNVLFHALILYIIHHEAVMTVWYVAIMAETIYEGA